MGLLDRLRHEVVDIVEWLDDTRHTLVWRFPRHQNEIKHGAKLIVRPGQVAVFVDQGQIADLFEPGTYTLTTENLPILATLKGWKYGFESPFKSEVYFVSTRQITDLKWGTPNPVMMRDPDFGPLRLRAFGTYTLKAVDPKALLRELVGTDAEFEAEEISVLLRSLISTTFADVLGTAEIPALDLAARYQELSDTLRDAVVERVDDEYGLDIPQLYIVNISLPDEVEKALDTRSSMGITGDMQRFQQYQLGNAMMAAANNPGGGTAGEGMGLGMGLAMANQMVHSMAQAAPAAPSAPGASVPPPLPQAVAWFFADQGQSIGPLTPAQVQAQAAAGKLTQKTLVWRAGMSGWSPAEEVPELAGLFGPPSPPPLP